MCIGGSGMCLSSKLTWQLHFLCTTVHRFWWNDCMGFSLWNLRIYVFFHALYSMLQNDKKTKKCKFVFVLHLLNIAKKFLVISYFCNDYAATWFSGFHFIPVCDAYLVFWDRVSLCGPGWPPRTNLLCTGGCQGWAPVWKSRRNMGTWPVAHPPKGKQWYSTLSATTVFLQTCVNSPWNAESVPASSWSLPVSQLCPDALCSSLFGLSPGLQYSRLLTRLVCLLLLDFISFVLFYLLQV